MRAAPLNPLFGRPCVWQPQQDVQHDILLCDVAAHACVQPMLLEAEAQDPPSHGAMPCHSSAVQGQVGLLIKYDNALHGAMQSDCH